jgi:predicted Zn-dependent peptidase
VTHNLLDQNNTILIRLREQLYGSIQTLNRGDVEKANNELSTYVSDHKLTAAYGRIIRGLVNQTLTALLTAAQTYLNDAQLFVRQAAVGPDKIADIAEQPQG